jgi:SAM-dependent methyltransferase
MDVRAYSGYLEDVYRQQLIRCPTPYVQAHSLGGGVQRQVKAAELYLPYVRGRVLDWGCFHAPDACLIRRHLGSSVELHGCDTHPADSECFAVFHAEAGLRYTQVTHPYLLPYEESHFDTVIADGVLEHVPNDYESLKELYRVLKPGGVLVISCLPNSLSYLEMMARCLRLPHHARCYSMRWMRFTLLHSGFQPICTRFLQMMPSLSGLGAVNSSSWLRHTAGLLWKGNAVLERLWPINRFATNLFLMARKCVGFSN